MIMMMMTQNLQERREGCDTDTIAVAAFVVHNFHYDFSGTEEQGERETVRDNTTLKTGSQAAEE